MKILLQISSLEDWSNLIAIGTPIVLALWFYYSQKIALSRDYYEELEGVYGGFTTPINKPKNNGAMYSGVILNIRDVYNKGFFRGEFDFAETESFTQAGEPQFAKPFDGIFVFYGDIDFKIYKDKKRNPFKSQDNRTYKGRFYVVDSLTFSGEEKQNLSDVLIAEYKLVHNRDRQMLHLTLKKMHRKREHPLPSEMILYKTMGLNFEPYENLKRIVFNNRTRVDQ